MERNGMKREETGKGEERGKNKKKKEEKGRNGKKWK